MNAIAGMQWCSPVHRNVNSLEAVLRFPTSAFGGSDSHNLWDRCSDQGSADIQLIDITRCRRTSFGTLTIFYGSPDSAEKD
jgi:hypothetical protein